MLKNTPQILQWELDREQKLLDAENADGFLADEATALTRTMVFAKVQENRRSMLLYTGYPHQFYEHVLSRADHALEIALLEAIRSRTEPDLNLFITLSPKEAMIVTMAYMRSGETFQHNGMCFLLSTRATTVVVRKTLPMMLQHIPAVPRPGRADWPALEQIGWLRFRISHVLGVIVIKPVWVESDDVLLLHPRLNRACWKVLLVVDLVGRIISKEIHPGSLDDRTIWQRCEFAELLKDPTNPLQLPKAMKDRANPGRVAHPVFLTNCLFPRGTSKYVFVRPGLEFVNNIRKNVELVCRNMMTRFRIFRTPLHRDLDARTVIRLTISLYNYGELMPMPRDGHRCGDEMNRCGCNIHHICSPICAHVAMRRESDSSLQTSTGVVNGRTNRATITQIWESQDVEARQHVDLYFQREKY